MSFRRFLDVANGVRGTIGTKIPDGHLYFGAATYDLDNLEHPLNASEEDEFYLPAEFGQENSSEESEAESSEEAPAHPIAMRLYMDQKLTGSNGRRIHGILCFGFPNGTFNIFVLPEHTINGVLNPLAALDMELTEVSHDRLPYRPALAHDWRSLKKTLNPHTLQELELEANRTGLARDAIYDKHDRQYNLIRIGPEFMSHEEMGKVCGALAEKEFLSKQNVRIIEKFMEVCMQPGFPDINRSRKEMAAFYGQKTGMGR